MFELPRVAATVFVFLAFFLFGPTAVAQANLMGSEPRGGASSILYSLDRATGAGDAIGAFAPSVAAMNGLAYDPIGGVLYGINPAANLFSINPATAQVIPIGQPGDLGASNVNGLAFDPALGILYATDNGTNRLYTIDVNTGAVNPVGTIGGGFSNVEGLGFDAETSTLYGLADGTGGQEVSYYGQIIIIDPTTANAVALGDPLPSSERLWRGLTFDPLTDGLIACGGTLYWIDPNTGVASYIGGMYVQGLAVIADLAPLLLSVDIRPGSDVNPVNLTSRGVLPVAVYGSEQFDVEQIDLSSLAMEGTGPNEKGKSGKVASVEDIDGDSWLDLVLHFDIQNLDIDATAEQLMLSGVLLDGTAFEGADSIRIVPPGDLNGDLVVDIVDLTALAANWSALSGGAKGWAQGDCNGDSVVDISDLTALAANWALTDSASPIPEPTTLVLLGLGGLMLIRRRLK